MVTRLLFFAGPLLLFVTTAYAQARGRAAEWRVVADVPLPGRAARFDYQSFDPTTGRLWIAHMGAGEVLAFDVGTRQVVARVLNLPGATGVLALPTLQRVFASLSGSRELALLDARSGRVLARVPGGRFPDGLAYAPAAHKLFASDEYGRQELVFEVPSFAARPPIAMGAEVGNTQYDSGSGRVWVVVQTRNELAAIDPMTDSVVARVPVTGIRAPHGLLVDAVHRLAYVAGEGNGRVGVLDLRTMRVVRTYPVGDDPDVLALDAERGRLFRRGGVRRHRGVRCSRRRASAATAVPGAACPLGRRGSRNPPRLPASPGGGWAPGAADPQSRGSLTGAASGLRCPLCLRGEFGSAGQRSDGSPNTVIPSRVLTATRCSPSSS